LVVAADEQGEEGLDNSGGGGGGAGMDIFDLFAEMHGMGGSRHGHGHGGFGGGGGQRRQRRGEDVNFPLKVTLEDMFKGTTKKLKLIKNVVCAVCKG
jgi:DnaJ family protein A protein 2